MKMKMVLERLCVLCVFIFMLVFFITLRTRTGNTNWSYGTGGTMGAAIAIFYLYGVNDEQH